MATVIPIKAMLGKSMTEKYLIRASSKTNMLNEIRKIPTNNNFLGGFKIIIFV